MADATALSEWTDRLRSHTVLPADRALVEASEGPRALVIELLSAGDVGDELYDACGVLGRLVVERGGSPSFAAALLDDAAGAVGQPGAPWLPFARAAVAEGFAARLSELAHRDATHAWEYPACAVRLGEGAVAIAAGHPSEDDEELAAWAARVARAVALSGIRRAVVSGHARARDAVIEALSFAGVEAQPSPVPAR